MPRNRTQAGSGAGRMPPLRRHPMTLVEILLATFILAIGLVSIMSLVPVAIHQAGEALQRSHGASVAQSARASLKRGRLDLYSGEYTIDTTIDWEDYSGPKLLIGSHPEPGDEEVPDVDIEDVYRYTDNDRYFIRAVPEGVGDAPPYAWTARVDFEPEPWGEDSRYWTVEIYVYFPPPYARRVYSTTFRMKKPQ